MNCQPHEKFTPRRRYGFPYQLVAGKPSVPEEQQLIRALDRELMIIREFPDETVPLTNCERCGLNNIPDPQILGHGYES